MAKKLQQDVGKLVPAEIMKVIAGPLDKTGANRWYPPRRSIEYPVTCRDQAFMPAVAGQRHVRKRQRGEFSDIHA
jgi:hypothetical protein